MCFLKFFKKIIKIHIFSRFAQEKKCDFLIFSFPPKSCTKKQIEISKLHRCEFIKLCKNPKKQQKTQIFPLHNPMYQKMFNFHHFFCFQITFEQQNLQEYTPAENIIFLFHTKSTKVSPKPAAYFLCSFLQFFRKSHSFVSHHFCHSIWFVLCRNATQTLSFARFSMNYHFYNFGSRLDISEFPLRSFICSMCKRAGSSSVSHGAGPVPSINWFGSQNSSQI